MEELLIIVFQVLIEIAMECLTYIPFDRPKSKISKEYTFGERIVIYMALGGGLGLLVNLLHPRLLLSHSVVRIGNLVLAPILNGKMSQLIAKSRQAKYPDIVPRRHFYYAAVFTFSFAVIRFIYGQR